MKSNELKDHTMAKWIEQIRGAIRSPMRVLTIGVLINLALLVAVASLVWSMYQSLSQVGKEALEVQRLLGKVAYLNELSTMSARMGAVTGDARWEQRYRKNEDKLDDSLVDLAVLAREEYERGYAADTKLAYTKLIEMESLAFALARNNRVKEATELLFSREYDQNKELYSRGLRSMTTAVQNRLDAEIKLYRQRIWKAGLMALVSLIILVVAWVGALVDLKRHLTSRRKAEKTVLEEKERLLVTLQSISDGVITADTDGKAVLVNPAAEKLTGWCQDEAAKMPVSELFEIVDEMTGRKYENLVDRVLRSESAFQLSNHTLLISREKGKKYIEQGAAPIRDHENQILGVVLVLRDVTERKRAVNALQESEEKYRTIIENMEEGYYEVDLKGNMASFNDSMARILGYSSEQLSGMSYRKFVDGSIVKEVEETFAGVSTTGKQAQVAEWELVGKDGNRRTIEASVCLVRDSDGKPRGFRGIVRDVTDRKRLEEQLRQAAKMEAIGTLAGGIAHDFNNILYVILGYSELTMDEAPKGSQLNFNLQQILSATERAKDLVDQILTFSRQRSQQKQIIRITPIIKETLKFLRASIPATVDIKESIELVEETILADPTQIHQILMNLCTNASHAMEERGGILEIRLDNCGIVEDSYGTDSGTGAFSYVRLTVSDTGHGMTPDVQARIFDPYFTTKTRGEGTGLGLAVVHGIVKAHKGHMEVRSEPKHGTTFQVLLPLAKGDTAVHSCASEAATPGSGERILLVDDERAVVNMSREILQQLGYQVSAESDSREALQLFRNDPHKFDLVITDMAMPKMTGKELATQLKAVRPDIPIILCTGFTDAITEEQAKKLGLRALMTKPINRKEMAGTIRSVLSLAL
jgi:two-component system cell cycle sensor histidine kinase/response regulator CckA